MSGSDYDLVFEVGPVRRARPLLGLSVNAVDVVVVDADRDEFVRLAWPGADDRMKVLALAPDGRASLAVPVPDAGKRRVEPARL
jgi:hypothetical protein